MKKLLTVILSIFCMGALMAQNSLNNKADNIVGVYAGTQDNESFKVKIVKLSDGTYRGQMIWVEHDRDEKGNKYCDVKNPDKSKRSTPVDRIVIFSGLKYDAKRHRWDDAKIYDPQRGIRANMTAEFMPDGRLRIRGSVLGIGESVYWKKVQ